MIITGSNYTPAALILMLSFKNKYLFRTDEENITAKHRKILDENYVRTLLLSLGERKLNLKICTISSWKPK